MRSFNTSFSALEFWSPGADKPSEVKPSPCGTGKFIRHSLAGSLPLQPGSLKTELGNPGK